MPELVPILGSGDIRSGSCDLLWKFLMRTLPRVLIFYLPPHCVWLGRGNILLAQDENSDTNHTMSFALQGKRMLARTFGLNVSIIDFTLSRMNTGAPLNFSSDFIMLINRLKFIIYFYFLQWISSLCDSECWNRTKLLQLCNLSLILVINFIFLTIIVLLSPHEIQMNNCCNW